MPQQQHIYIRLKPRKAPDQPYGDFRQVLPSSNADIEFAAGVWQRRPNSEAWRRLAAYLTAKRAGDNPALAPLFESVDADEYERIRAREEREAQAKREAALLGEDELDKRPAPAEPPLPTAEDLGLTAKPQADDSEFASVAAELGAVQSEMPPAAVESTDPEPGASDEVSEDLAAELAAKPKARPAPRPRPRSRSQK